MKQHLVSALILGALLGHTQMHAQSKSTIDNIKAVSLRNTGPIIANEEIKGYFSFYQSDKIDKHTNEYTLQILDENLNKVKSFKFTDSKNIALLESSYNGADIMFMFYDSENKMLDYRVYGMEGKQKFNYSRAIDKKTRSYINQYFSMNSEETQNKSLFSVDEKGFATVIPVREGRQYTYEVSFYQTDKKKSWTYAPEDAERISQAQYLGYSDSVVIFEVLKKTRLLSNKMESYILGVNLHNGKKAFEFETDREKYNFYPMNIAKFKTTNNYMLMGPYYDKDDKVNKDKSLGLGVWVMNNQGQVVAARYNSWDSDISKFLKIDKRGRVDDLGYIYFHKIIQTEDGKIFAVGEGYKRVASALGIGLKVLEAAAGGVSTSSTTKMKITDMVLMQFDEQFNVVNAQIYDKNSNSIELMSGGDFMSVPLLAQYIKYVYDGFDYSYSQTDKTHTTFTVCYTDYVRSREYKGLTFNAISYYNNNLTTDKINLKTNASSMRTFPAKTGSVMVMEYFKKDKRIEMRLEKLN